MKENAHIFTYDGHEYVIEPYKDKSDKGFKVSCPSMNKFKKYAVDNETASSHVTSSQQSAYDELRDQVISDIKAGRY